MNIKDQLKRDEGLSLNAYPDPLTGGEPFTIGYGHTSNHYGSVKEGDTITLWEADKLLEGDIRDAASDVKYTLDWTKHLDEARFSVLVNMCFNLGIKRLLGFKNTLWSIQSGHYDEAAENMLDSKWAEQVKGRAHRLAEQMKTGEWV